MTNQVKLCKKIHHPPARAREGTTKIRSPWGFESGPPISSSLKGREEIQGELPASPLTRCGAPLKRKMHNHPFQKP